MGRKTLIAVIIVLVLAACSSAPKIDLGTAFAPVRTIELRDATDPLILASTGAGRVREYFDMGLKHRGYSVCRDCTADAVATVVVREYNTRQVIDNSFLFFGRVVRDLARVRLEFTVVRDGETIYQQRINRGGEAMAIDQLAARHVQVFLEQIPARK
jgi:hypothetical protein